MPSSGQKRPEQGSSPMRAVTNSLYAGFPDSSGKLTFPCCPYVEMLILTMLLCLVGMSGRCLNAQHNPLAVGRSRTCLHEPQSSNLCTAAFCCHSAPRKIYNHPPEFSAPARPEGRSDMLACTCCFQLPVLLPIFLLSSNNKIDTPRTI